MIILPTRMWHPYLFKNNFLKKSIYDLGVLVGKIYGRNLWKFCKRNFGKNFGKNLLTSGFKKCAEISIFQTVPEPPFTTTRVGLYDKTLILQFTENNSISGQAFSSNDNCLKHGMLKNYE